jgi:hypothetical protein
MPIKVPSAKATGMIQHLYKTLFDREPEPEVLNGLIRYFEEGRVSARTQLMSMLKSEEFFDKRLRHKTPEDMAAELYRYILARDPESPEALQGAANFVGNLGWKVEVDVMINSEEYLGRFGDDDLPAFTVATEAQARPDAQARSGPPVRPQPPARRELPGRR